MQGTVDSGIRFSNKFINQQIKMAKMNKKE